MVLLVVSTAPISPDASVFLVVLPLVDAVLLGGVQTMWELGVADAVDDDAVVSGAVGTFEHEPVAAVHLHPKSDFLHFFLLDSTSHGGAGAGVAVGIIIEVVGGVDMLK